MQPRIAFYSRRAFSFLFAICISAMLLACSSTRAYTPELWQQTIPNGTLVFRICRRHPLVSPETRYWYIEKGNSSPRTTHLPLPELLESGTAKAVFIYDPYAPTESRIVLGLQFDKLPCDKPPPPPPPPPPPWKMEAKAEPPRKSAQTTVKTVARPHSAQSRNARLDQRFIGQSYPTPAPTPGSKAPEPPPPPGNTPAEQRANLTQMEAEAKAKRDGERVGAAWGDVVGKATAALETLDGVLGGSLAEILQRNPKFAEDLRNGLAQKMNAIPALPAYEDPKLAKIAFDGFLKGYGQGVDDARLEFGLVNGLATALLMVSGDTAAAVETAGAKALRAAWTRLREMPIFVPIGAGGVGGFVRLSKVSAPAAAAKAEAEAAKTTVTTKVTPTKTANVTSATTTVTTKAVTSSPKAPRLKKDGTPRAKPGPRTEDTAPHNAAVIRERERLEAEGNRIVNGGRKPGLKEEVVDTKGGHKDTRRPDITYVTPEGDVRGRNVGKTKKDGTPVKREQQALDDLNNHSKRKTDFVPYDR